MSFFCTVVVNYYCLSWCSFFCYCFWSPRYSGTPESHQFSILNRTSFALRQMSEVIKTPFAMAILRTLVHLHMEQHDTHAEICIFGWHGSDLCINIDVLLHSSRKMPSCNEVKHGKKQRHTCKQAEDLSPSKDRTQEKRNWKKQQRWRGNWPPISYTDEHWCSMCENLFGSLQQTVSKTCNHASLSVPWQLTPPEAKKAQQKWVRRRLGTSAELKTNSLDWLIICSCWWLSLVSGKAKKELRGTVC